MSARITIPTGDVAGTVREALRAALDARGIGLCGNVDRSTGTTDYFSFEILRGDDLEFALHELGKVAARAIALLDVDKLAPGEERGVAVMDVAG